MKKRLNSEGRRAKQKHNNSDFDEYPFLQKQPLFTQNASGTLRYVQALATFEVIKFVVNFIKMFFNKLLSFCNDSVIRDELTTIKYFSLGYSHYTDR